MSDKQSKVNATQIILGHNKHSSVASSTNTQPTWRTFHFLKGDSFLLLSVYIRAHKSLLRKGLL